MPVIGKAEEKKKVFKRWDNAPRPRKDKRKKPKVIFACDECGKEFALTETAAEGRRFCSTQCADAQRAVPIAQRFIKLFEKTPAGCWEWQGRLNIGGYGTIRREDRMVLAHRVSLEIFREAPPSGSVVCHMCNNRKCVNPTHLYIGTHDDNMLDLAIANTSSFSKTEWADRKRMFDLVEAGTPEAEVAEAFGVSPRTVLAWHKRFKDQDRVPLDLET